MRTPNTANNLNQLTAASGGGKMRFAGTVNEPATVTVGGNSANVSSDGHYEGYAQVITGQMNTIHIVATDKEENVTDKYVTITPSAVAAQTFAYDDDDNGNQTAKPGAAYEYDAANRLVKITLGSDITTFAYDGLSRRIHEKLNGVETKHLIWDGLKIAEERNSTNIVTKCYYAQGFSRNATPTASDLFYYTRDHLGSIRELTDSTGTLRARYSYDPYGKRSANQITSNPIESDFGYTGHYHYESLGLIAAPYRFYDPGLGRWLNRDPIGENGGVNLYGYVINNTINNIDPNGLCEWILVHISKGMKNGPMEYSHTTKPRSWQLLTFFFDKTGYVPDVLYVNVYVQVTYYGMRRQLACVDKCGRVEDTREDFDIFGEDSKVIKLEPVFQHTHFSSPLIMPPPIS